MPDYKLYYLDDNGWVYRRDDASSPSDQIVLVLAQTLSQQSAIEVWESSRRVGTIPKRHHERATSGF